MPDHIFSHLDSDQGDLSPDKRFEQTLSRRTGSGEFGQAFIQSTHFLLLLLETTANLGLEQRDSVFTMGLFCSDYPRECGIAVLDDEGSVVEFAEKPKNPKSSLANAGIYVANPALLDYIPEGSADLGYDVLPKLAGRMHGYQLQGYLRDIGTPKNYRKAQEEWKCVP